MADQFRTVFGTTTDSRVVATLSKIGYTAAILMTLYFAYEGFKVVRPDVPFVIRCAFAAVVALVLGTGLKLLLWRRKRFDGWMLVLCLLGATPALFFNFIGFYHVTGEKSIVRSEREEAQQTLRAYDGLVRREAGKAESVIEATRRDETGKADAAYREEVALLERRVSNAALLATEEVAGVKREETTGLEGHGDFARQREADKARAEADYKIDLKKLDDDHQAKVDAVNEAADVRMGHLRNAVDLLDDLSGYEKPGENAALEAAALEAPTGVIEDGNSSSDEIAASESLDELDEAGRKANKLMAQVNSEYTSAGLSALDPKPIRVIKGNLFDLSVLGLVNLEVSALVSLFVAVMLDWLDCFIVFLWRRREDDEEAQPGRNNGVDHPERPAIALALPVAEPPRPSEPIVRVEPPSSILGPDGNPLRR